MPTNELRHDVPGISCAHCRTAITEEVTGVPGVTAVEVDLQTRMVTVRGNDLDDAAVRAAIEEAGYEVTS